MAMQKAQMTGKATPDAVKAGAKSTKEETTAVALTVKKGALSVDVGPAAIKLIAAAEVDQEKADQLLAQSNRNRTAVLTQLTAAIAKAARADDTIDLTATMSAGPDAAQRMQRLNDQLGLALGFREVVMVGNGDKARPKTQYAKTVTEYFPVAGMDKESPDYKRRNSIRTTFLTQLKHASRAALYAIDTDSTVKVDKKQGALMLEGPQIKKDFGASRIVLNGKQIGNMQDGTDKNVQLKDKPSFASVAAKAGEAHGKVTHRGSNTRGASAELTNPSAALEKIATSLIEALQRIKKPSEATVDVVRKVESSVDAWLAEHGAD